MAGASEDRRKRVGRKPHDPPLRATMVRLTEAQMKLLRVWGKGYMAAGLRWLIDVAAPLIVKPAEAAPPQSLEEQG